MQSGNDNCRGDKARAMPNFHAVLGILSKLPPLPARINASNGLVGSRPGRPLQPSFFNVKLNLRTKDGDEFLRDFARPGKVTGLEGNSGHARMAPATILLRERS